MAAAYLVAVAAVSGCGANVSPEQKAALAKIQDLGGSVTFKNGGYKVDLTNTPVEDKDLESLKHIANLKRVDLQGTRIGDDGLQHLSSITSLEIIVLQRTVATRNGIEKLKKALPKTDVQF